MTNLPETQKSLLVRLAEVDHETVGAAWTTFLSIYEPAIFRFALSGGLQDADARDVTQQVLLAVHQKLPEWDLDQGKCSFRGWLFLVARNLASKKLRTKRRQAKLWAASLDNDVAHPPDEEASVFFLEYRKLLIAQHATIFSSFYRRNGATNRDPQPRVTFPIAPNVDSD